MNTAAVQTPRPSNLKNVMLLAIALGVAEAGIEHYSEPLHGIAGLLGGATSLLMGLLIGLRANAYGSAAVGGLLTGGGICMGVIGGLIGRAIPRSK